MPSPRCAVDATDYARRIVESLRADGWPLRVPGYHGQHIAARYGVAASVLDAGTEYRLADVAEAIATDIARRVNV